MKEFVEKLISRLEELNLDRIRMIEDGKYELIRKKEAIEIVNELAEEYNNGWIPCSERLPEVDVYVLCQGNHSMFIAYVDGFDNKWRDCHFITRTTVKAWQPLPQPYKPQKLEWKDKVMKHFTNVE